MKIQQNEKGTILLPQFLKLMDVLSSGGELRYLLEEGAVWINGKRETAKRKQLKEGDMVEIRLEEGTRTYRVHFSE